MPVTQSDFSKYSIACTISFANPIRFSRHCSSEELRFDFRSGRILDPEGKYIFYKKRSGDFIVSGNINRQDYNYYVNDLPIVSNGSKNDFVTKSFFLDCTGCKIETRNLVISASGSGNFYHYGFNRNVV